MDYSSFVSYITELAYNQYGTEPTSSQIAELMRTHQNQCDVYCDVEDFIQSVRNEMAFYEEDDGVFIDESRKSIKSSVNDELYKYLSKKTDCTKTDDYIEFPDDGRISDKYLDKFVDKYNVSLDYKRTGDTMIVYFPQSRQIKSGWERTDMASGPIWDKDNWRIIERREHSRDGNDKYYMLRDKDNLYKEDIRFDTLAEAMDHVDINIESSHKITSSVIDKVLGKTSEYCENYLIRLGYKPLEFNKQNRPIEFKNDKDSYIYVFYDSMGYVEDFNEEQWVESSRNITSARYIATDPETGEVLGSADTYEEAVNEWGEDVTITDSEVGDETDTTQGGILSSWDNDTPRGEGWLAHDDGKQKGECPYEIGTVEYEDWIDGWEAAYQEVNSSKESNHQFSQRIVNSVLTKEITEDEAIKQIASRNNMNIGFAKRIFNNLMEDKSLIQSGVMEMADDMNQEFNLNGDLYSWFDDYVNLDGKATTVGGELVRAANQILARFENDGDKIGIGYGKETVNPAARYILAICNDYIDRNDIEEMLWNESRINYSDEEYEAWLQQFQRTFQDYLRDHEELFHSPNKNDMWDYKEEDDVNSSVDECCIYDNEGNEYWFRKDDNDWKCTNIEFSSDPKYEIDETFGSASEFEEMIYSKGEQQEPYGFFSEDGFTYNWEGTSEDDEGNYREWMITDVSVDGGLADVGDVWSADNFEDYDVIDTDGKELTISDLY